jgi:hypothetical protein
LQAAREKIQIIWIWIISRITEHEDELSASLNFHPRSVLGSASGVFASPTLEPHHQGGGVWRCARGEHTTQPGLGVTGEGAKGRGGRLDLLFSSFPFFVCKASSLQVAKPFNLSWDITDLKCIIYNIIT